MDKPVNCRSLSQQNSAFLKIAHLIGASLVTVPSPVPLRGMLSNPLSIITCSSSHMPPPPSSQAPISPSFTLPLMGGTKEHFCAFWGWGLGADGHLLPRMEEGGAT